MKPTTRLFTWPRPSLASLTREGAMASHQWEKAQREAVKAGKRAAKQAKRELRRDRKRAGSERFPSAFPEAPPAFDGIVSTGL